jgi:hypothetical protein
MNIKFLASFYSLQPTPVSSMSSKFVRAQHNSNSVPDFTEDAGVAATRYIFTWEVPGSKLDSNISTLVEVFRSFSQSRQVNPSQYLD